MQPRTAGSGNGAGAPDFDILPAGLESRTGTPCSVRILLAGRVAARGRGAGGAGAGKGGPPVGPRRPLVP